MRAVLISDMHGNLEALTAVLRDIDHSKVDRLYSLGDVVGYGCDPSACLNIVNKYFDVKLLGNHEALLLEMLTSEHYNTAAKVSAEWTRSTLSEQEIQTLASFELETSRDGFHMVHGSPWEPGRFNYILAPEEAKTAFGHFDERICFCGHTHVPMIFTEIADALPRSKTGHTFLPDEESRYIINIGSVGQPRDNDPRACYVILDTVEGDVEFHRVSYDIISTQKKMTRVDLPEVLIERLAVGR